MSKQKNSKNKQETVKVIFAKNAETVDFGKHHLWYDKGVFKYNLNKNFSCRKQLSNNCGVFIINAKIESKNPDINKNQDANKKFLLIVEPQYGIDFLDNMNNIDNIEKLIKKAQEKLKNNTIKDDFNKLIFTNREGLFYKDKDTKDENNINISQIPENQRKNCIEKINCLIRSYNEISKEKIHEIKTEEKNGKNKDTENKDIEIPIPTFAFNIANIFEVVARAAIKAIIKNDKKNAIKNSENTKWEVLNGNEYEVLKKNKDKEDKDKEDEDKEDANKEDANKENENIKGNDEFYINGTVKPDIIIRKKDEKEYIIIDVKYKSPENKNRMDRLQILAYAYLYDAHIVGHIFPQKSNETNKELSFYNINTPLGDYKYVELYLDGSLKENIEKIKKKLLEMKNETSNN